MRDALLVQLSDHPLGVGDVELDHFVSNSPAERPKRLGRFVGPRVPLVRSREEAKSRLVEGANSHQAFKFTLVMLNTHAMLRFHRSVGDTELLQKAEAYLREAFGLSANLEPLRLEGLPYFIEDQYELWRADLFGRDCILMAARGASESTTDEMARHVELVRGRAEIHLVILVFASLTPARRRSLVSRRMGFLVPGAQLFVPDALLDLRERTPRPPLEEVQRFSPTTQLVILGALLKKEAEGVSATNLARRYGVAIMSITRAFDELDASGVARARRDGRERHLRFQALGRELWDLTRTRLQTPVRKVRTAVIPHPEQFPARVAGESALSIYTSLASPRVRRLAVASADWNQLVRDHGLRETERGDLAADEIETWTYDPGALADPQIVDPLSLHLSLRHHPDERVAGAADELLESFAWF